MGGLHSFHPKLQTASLSVMAAVEGSGGRGAACASQEIACSRLVGGLGGGGESHGG